LGEGIIIKGIGGNYTIFDGKDYHNCVARGIFRKNKVTPLPGDQVEFADGAINKIFPRRNEFVRPAVSNIDQLAFFLPIKYPEPDLYLLDKMLLTAFEKRLDILLCINKCDCDDTHSYREIDKIYSKLGIKVLLLEAINGRGIDELSENLANKITVFAGQSGAGKSTTLNGVFQEEMMQTGSISAKTERGKHTTRHAELFRYGEGFVVDTPGFSSHDLPDYTASELASLYPEFEEHLGNCRFKECIHINEPDCAVKNALNDEEIDSGRYNRYKKFIDIVAERKANKYK